MVDNNCIIEGNVKFRDGKKWKSRWCVMRKLSPVADCLHLQLYGDSKDRYKHGQTKASLSLQHFLGVETGFTLDKESNTIAIICQDVTVVLAFDTREQLIQWQVKISNNLGEDQQFLILISSAPAKAKLATGPAHLHVQDRRFCITTSIPPRLVGVWDIAHLRRYGVVDGRFCFEGGSRCGKGEGLHVLVTDQGEAIAKTLQLAAESKLSTRKRPVTRESTTSDSPRRQFSRSETRASDFFPSIAYNSISYEANCDGCKTESSPYWSSTESRQQTDLDSDYGCRDSVSVSELNDQPGEWRSSSFVQQNTSTLERCSSCIGKLGTLSKSMASANATGTAPSTSPAPILNSQLAPRAFDRLSLSSYSSSSHESDYSVSHKTDCRCAANKSHSQCSHGVAAARPVIFPPRPPKPQLSSTSKAKKPVMPLPNEHACSCSSSKVSLGQNNHLSPTTGPYENYDVPKAILGHVTSADRIPCSDQYYDTPRKIKECLALPKSYANYDTPLVPQAVPVQQCGCPAKLSSHSPRSSACPCHNVMSWAGFVLPYCRRGAGIVLDAVHPVRLSGEGKMPVVNASGELAIYATVDRKSIAKQSPTAPRDCDCNAKTETDGSGNYENVGPVIDKQPESKQANYANIDFTQSLEHYENSKDVLTKAKLSKHDLQKYAESLKDPVDRSANENAKVCNKCGHAKDQENDYLVMNPEKGMPKKPFPGYLAMEPAHNACSKEVLSRICSAGKSSSHPTLAGPQSTETSNKKRCDSEHRIPGSAMLSSPYLRRRVLESTSTESSGNNATLARKRSYSAESARHIEDDKSALFPSTLTIHKCASEADKGFLINRDQNTTCMSTEMKAYNGSEETSVASSQPCSIKIRRSSSVPSKTGHNRDSSSSNDSGVSTGSLSHKGIEFVEFEAPTIAPTSVRRNLMSSSQKTPPPACFHNSLPRKSKSSDPLRELSFQFQKMKVPAKCSSAAGDIPICAPKNAKGFNSPSETLSAPYIDSRSTSSGTSDMSDYIETLSLSSHSSSDAPDSLRMTGRQMATTLRPRSGKEYYKIDRSILVEQARLATETTTNYANITPVLEKSEPPLPGYINNSPFDQPQPTRDHFLYSEQA